MCKALYEIKKHAKKQGVKQGETRLASLVNKLSEDGRMEDVKLAAVDEAARETFYKEYGIA